MKFFSVEKIEAAFIWRECSLPLGDALAGTATWFQHPQEGQDVDIAALPVTAEHVGRGRNLLDPTGHDPDMFVDLGGELFLPGFPLGLASAGAFPIWKRASLASSTEFGEGVDRYLYVDTATREGMSGAPCLALSNWRHYRLDRETGKMSIIETPMSWRIMGVYSGRRNASDSFEAQIGIVWRDKLLFETLDSAVAGSVLLRE